MKKDKDEEAIALIERNPVLVAVMIIVTVALGWWCYSLFDSLSGWAFLVVIPAIVIGFHTLWMMMNPFARIYKNRAEFHQTWFHNRDTFFNDLISVNLSRRGAVVITYTDGEREKLPLFGIRSSHRQLLRDSFQKQIEITTRSREQ